jgi:hypothetical protein
MAKNSFPKTLASTHQSGHPNPFSASGKSGFKSIYSLESPLSAAVSDEWPNFYAF